MPDWWLGESDHRPNEPYISAERWDKELRATGFSGTDSVVYDFDQPYQENAQIMSSPVEERPISQGVTLLHGSNPSPLLHHLEALLVRRGFRVDFNTMDQAPPPNQDIISMVDLSSPYFDCITSKELATFQCYVGKMQSSGILWATRPIQVACKDLRCSPVVGSLSKPPLTFFNLSKDDTKALTLIPTLSSQ